VSFQRVRKESSIAANTGSHITGLLPLDNQSFIQLGLLLNAMAPASNDPISATTLDPALCGLCPNLGIITYPGCGNMRYCSQQCLQRDSSQHNILCNTFQDFQQRPRDNHYRAIYFPPNELRPRFIWVLKYASRGGQSIDTDDIKRYVSRRPSGRHVVTSHHGLNPAREYKNMMVIEHDDDMFGNRQPPNSCLFRLIGPHAARWLGEYVGHAYKYTYGDDESVYDAEDVELGRHIQDFPLIALDLDTTSLGPLVAYLSWCSQNERSGGGFFGF
jgi:hypothetical protein